MLDEVNQLNACYFKYIVDTICIHHDETPYTDADVGKLVRSILGEYIKDIQNLKR